MRPRRTLLIGVLVLGVAGVYGILSRDAGGATMLAALGVAMGLMAYVLVAGSPSGDDGA